MADISTGTLTFPGFSPSTYFRFCRLKSRSRLPFFKISTHCEMSLKSLQREWTVLVAYRAATASYVFACWKYCVNSQYIDFFFIFLCLCLSMRECLQLRLVYDTERHRITLLVRTDIHIFDTTEGLFRNHRRRNEIYYLIRRLTGSEEICYWLSLANQWLQSPFCS